MFAIHGPSTEQQWEGKNNPLERDISKIQPRKQDISVIAVWIVQQSYQISTGRPMSQNSIMFAPKDELLG